MSADNVPEPSDLITQVMDAFELMRVPPGPSARETIELLERATAGHGNSATDVADNAPGQRIVMRDEECPGAVAPYSRGKEFTGMRSTLAMRCARLTLGQRITIGSIGLSTVVGLILLFLALNSGTQLSAMERMAKELHEVRSYSYTLSTQNTFVKEGKSQPTYVKRTGTVYWLAPGSLFAEESIVHVDGPIRPGDDKGELVVHIAEIFPAGKPGIIIDHKAKTFAWLPELRADDIPSGSPINMLRMVREGVGEVVRDLGTKAIKGKPARGYVMALMDAAPGSGSDALEVWVDPETDLPLEFGYTLKNDKGPEFFRVTDCRWNIKVDPQWFATTPPKGYTDATLPATKESSGESSSR
jgi:hypothetical protein